MKVGWIQSIGLFYKKIISWFFDKIIKLGSVTNARNQN